MGIADIVRRALGVTNGERAANRLTRAAAEVHAQRAIAEAAESARLRKLEYAVDLKRGRFQK